jgi:hypothetical protein
VDANEESIVKSSLGRNDSGRNEQEEEKSENIGKVPMSDERNKNEEVSRSRVMNHPMGVTMTSRVDYQDPNTLPCAYR